MEPASLVICEDEALVALELKHRVEAFGYKVVGIASGGEEACALASKYRPDLALMDICLKGELTGTQVAEVLVREFDIPSIFLTAYSDPETVRDASRTNPLGYLIKPVRDRELELSIKFGLDQHRRQKLLKEKISQNNKKLERTKSILNDMSSSLSHEIRMRGLQDLIGGIAHYFNNSIMSISPLLEILRDEGHIQPFLNRQIQRILDSYEEQRTFVQHLLWASGYASLHIAPHVYQDILSEAISAVAPPGSSLKILKQVPEEPVKLFIDGDAVTHAIINVLVNAREVIGVGGSISLHLDESFEEVPERHNSAAVAGKYHVVTIKDSGPGIPNGIVDKVVEPFFTTNHDRLATGLGLSETYGIFQAHGGWITVDSQQGHGTTVQLYLPHTVNEEH